MSGVATLKIRGTKRHFDEMAVDFPVQPQACSPARLRPPPLKRGRSNPTTAASASAASSAVAQHPARDQHFRPPPHPLVTTAPQTASAAAAHAPSPSHDAASASPAQPPGTASGGSPSTDAPGAPQPADGAPPSPPSAPARPLTTAELSCLARFVPRRLKRMVERVAAGLTAPTDRLFSAADVRDAVAAAVAERDAKLSAQFAAVLQERLAEQFRDFTKFNEDYVTRQLRGYETTYLS